MCFWNLFVKGNPSGNVPSPRVDIDIERLTDGIKITGVKITTVQNTNSMEPAMDVGHTILLTDKIEDLKVGDVVIWEQNGNTRIHAIVESGYDDLGNFYRTQGWNTTQKDREIIRKLDVKYLCLGVLWTRGEGYYKSEEGD